VFEAIASGIEPVQSPADLRQSGLLAGSHVCPFAGTQAQQPFEAVVFPLRMYGVAGHYLGLADHLDIVADIGHAGTWVALGAWALTFVAMLTHLGRLFARARRGGAVS
jgi:hypothetical protein